MATNLALDCSGRPNDGTGRFKGHCSVPASAPSNCLILLASFDDKQIVVNATIRMLVRGGALPLLLDLARKPVFLHDNSVSTLDALLDSSRGATAPHPFYVGAGQENADVVAFLKSLEAN